MTSLSAHLDTNTLPSGFAKAQLEAQLQAIGGKDSAYVYIAHVDMRVSLIAVVDPRRINEATELPNCVGGNNYKVFYHYASFDAAGDDNYHRARALHNAESRDKAHPGWQGRN